MIQRGKCFRLHREARARTHTRSIDNSSPLPLLPLPTHSRVTGGSTLHHPLLFNKNLTWPDEEPVSPATLSRTGGNQERFWRWRCCWIPKCCLQCRLACKTFPFPPPQTTEFQYIKSALTPLHRLSILEHLSLAYKRGGENIFKLWKWKSLYASNDIHYIFKCTVFSVDKYS